MFIRAIKQGTNYIKPLVTGKVLYRNRQIHNIINSLIVLNANGDILTCGHIADLFVAAEDTNKVFDDILEKISTSNKRNTKKLEEKYGIKDDTVIRIHNIIVDIAKKFGKLDIIKHQYLNLAIIRLNLDEEISTKNFPIFKTDEISIGKSVCNLGFAFPEYDAFNYDKKNEKLVVTNKNMNFPLFPTTGIITRNIIDPNSKLSMFETSAPCYIGQAGGVVLDTNGYTLGMILGNKMITMKDSLNSTYNANLTVVAKAKEITDFLEQHNISYSKTQDNDTN